jgi:alkylation response protein AidB-like acyl-CoA dehydrogenase
LFAARAAMSVAAGLWEAGDHDTAELESVRTLHLAKRVAIDISQRAFDVCGARATFRTYPLERILRDVRTFSLHFRDEHYMQQVGQAMLDGTFRAKGYAGASTFPEAGSRA